MKRVYNIEEYDLWNFIEENLPNYHQRDDVLYNDIVSRYVNGEDLSDSDYEMMREHFDINYDAAEQWLENDIKRLFLEAVEATYDNKELFAVVLK